MSIHPYTRDYIQWISCCISGDEIGRLETLVNFVVLLDKLGLVGTRSSDGTSSKDFVSPGATELVVGMLDHVVDGDGL